MTLENIIETSEKAGMTLIILTPHFHKKVVDDTASLYEDTNEEILLKLREQIDAYKGKLKILLSTEVDVLDIEGNNSLKISKSAENALDLITPTVNYHPLLPLKAVEVTYSRCIEQMHKSGLYNDYANRIGGVKKVLESLYQTEINAIKKAQYPMMLGHFFAAHSYAVGIYNWFGAKPEHIDIIKEGALSVIDACVKKDALIDLTGIHHDNMTHKEKIEMDGFFFDFQRWFIKKCQEKGVMVFPGSDAHWLPDVGAVHYYKNLIN
jgi:histidinol phosphatase-like PHP family hydrolase